MQTQAMNHKHSEPFYISPRLFHNGRLKRRHSRWQQKVRERQKQNFAGGVRRSQLLLPRRRVATTLPAEVTIDLLSDDDDDVEQHGHAQQSQTPLQVSVVPNITLVPVVPLHNSASSTSNLLLMPVGGVGGHHRTTHRTTTRTAHRPRKRREAIITESIVITSDEEEEREIPMPPLTQPLPSRFRRLQRSPPPLAPLTLTISPNIEEVTVSLVPRTTATTTTTCKHPELKEYRRRSRITMRNGHNDLTTTTSTTTKHRTTAAAAALTQCLTVDVNGGGGSTETDPLGGSGGGGYGFGDDSYADGGGGGGGDDGGGGELPDETTVHTVIANRIYELSLSKLREGLATSAVADHVWPEELQNLTPALRAKVAPMVNPVPAPPPISLKLSSDLSISLISDDDDCGNGVCIGGGGGGGGGGGAGRSSTPGGDAHAAATLLKQQQPQLSVVQHLQYAGGPVALALPVVAPVVVATTNASRRHKLG